MQARQLSAREGMLWLSEGFRLYRANPPLLITLTLSYLFLVLGVSNIPWIGTVAVNLGLPFFVVMVANGCRAIDEGHARPLPLSLLLDGLPTHRPALVWLGGLNLIGSVTALLIGRGISTLLDAPDVLDPQTASVTDTLKVMLPPFLVGSPLLLAFWFSPLLTAWQGVLPAKSLFFSLVACLRNWQAFSVFGIAALGAGMLLPGLLLALPGLIFPAALGVFSILLGVSMMFFLAPILMTSVYVGYRSIFLDA